ncbi:MAG: ABC transporter permease [Eisenbergiella sp.]
MVLLFIFNYLPLYGWKIAFQKFIPAKGLFGDQKWVGLYWFQYISKYPDFIRALRNTLMISLGKLALGILIAILFSILINEIRNSRLKRTVQTIVYLPHFLSWIILSGVLIDILSPSTGIVNKLIMAFGGQPAFFLGDNRFFQGTMIVTDIWKEFGFNTIVYLAAITSIDPSLYESAVMDGANRLQQIIHITLPGMLPIIMLMLLLNIGSVMNANFDQIFNLYSPTVYKTGDVLDTLVYRIGLVNANYSLSTAIGIFKSMVSMLLVGTSYYSAYKFAGYRIF